MFQNNQQILNFLKSDVCGLSVAVLGDVMLDRYYFGEVKRVSPEAPVPVTKVLAEREVLGGAANVAQNLARLGCQVYLAGVAGEDENQQRLSRLLQAARISDSGIIKANRPTTTKLRIMGGHQQMLRLDFEETGELTTDQQKILRQYIASLSEQKIQALIISDYGKGVCSLKLCQCAIKWANRVGVPVIVDPKGTDWRKYTGAGFITPNLKELGSVARVNLPNEDEKIEKAAVMLRKRYSIDNLIVTRSEKGLSLINAEMVKHIPTRAQEVFDVSGAGDTVIAVLGAALGADMPLDDAAQLANLAAGIAVGRIGTYAVSREELQAVIETDAAGYRALVAATKGREENCKIK